MSRIRPDISRAELGAVVCEELARHRIDAVLVGGAVVSIYSDGRYVSNDLDFVTHKQDKALRPHMATLGFQKKGMYWVHPDTELLVQFVAPPVMVGNKYIQHPDRLETAAGTLTILSPLDCVLDRLAGYLSYRDRQCLEQAVSVAAGHAVDLDEVRRWIEGEGGDRQDNLLKFKEFTALVLKARAGPTR